MFVCCLPSAICLWCCLVAKLRNRKNDKSNRLFSFSGIQVGVDSGDCIEMISESSMIIIRSLYWYIDIVVHKLIVSSKNNKLISTDRHHYNAVLYNDCYHLSHIHFTHIFTHRSVGLPRSTVTLRCRSCDLDRFDAAIPLALHAPRQSPGDAHSSRGPCIIYEAL